MIAHQLNDDERVVLAFQLSRRFAIDIRCVILTAMHCRTEKFWTPAQRPFFSPAIAVYIRDFWPLDTEPLSTGERYSFEEERKQSALAVHRATIKDGHEFDIVTSHTETAIWSMLDRQINRLFVVYELSRQLPRDMQASSDNVRYVSAEALRRARTESVTKEPYFETWLFMTWIQEYLKYGFHHAKNR